MFTGGFSPCFSKIPALSFLRQGMRIMLKFFVCRLNEAVMHFGESIKEIINEEFGDGM